MKVFKPALVIWIIVLALLFSFSPKALFAQSNYSILTKSFPQQDTTQGQCVALVRKLRPDVNNTAAPTDPKGSKDYMAAFTMFKNAEQKGVLQTDNKPRVGAVIVWDKIEDKLPYGHVGIVKEITTKEGKIELVVADSNWSKGLDEKYRERHLIFDSNSSTVSGGEGTLQYKILGFIYERKEIYDLKKGQASESIDKVYRKLLHRPADEDGKQFYGDMLLNGGTIKDVENSIRNSHEYGLKTHLTNVAKSVIAKRTGNEIPALFLMSQLEMKTAMTTPAFLALRIDTATDTTQEQTTKNVEDTGTVRADRPTTHYGHYVGMLTMDDAGSKSFNRTYITWSRQNFDSSNIVVGDEECEYFIADGSQDYDDPTITSMKVYYKTPTIYLNPITSGLPVAVSHEEYGYNAYLEWGKWAQDNPMSDGQYNFYFDNPGWYVFGDITTNSQMSSLAAKNISGTYTGDARGTYWTDSGGVIMQGTFSCDVSFSARTISNFGLSVSGGGHSATVSGASGSFSGSSGEFNVPSHGGTWKIDGDDAISYGADGSVYGQNAEAIGGVWAAHNNPANQHVRGVFAGSR